MLKDLSDPQIDQLIDIIAVVHKTAIKKIYPILSEIKKDHSYKLTPDDWKKMEKWYMKPEEAKKRDIYKVAKVFTYVVIERLYPGQMKKHNCYCDLT